MTEDVLSKEYYSVEERYADLINGLGFQGRQVVKKEDLQELDTQTGIWQMPFKGRKKKRSIRNRDLVRKTAFDVIRCSEAPDKLKELVTGDSAYQNMEEDAYDMIAAYTNVEELISMKEYHRKKGGKVDMCGAIAGLIEEGKIEGKLEGRLEGIKALIETCEEFNVSKEDTLARIKNKFSLSEENAETYLEKYWGK